MNCCFFFSSWILWVFFGCLINGKGFLIKDPEKVATEFIILHNNDMHSRFEEVDSRGRLCSSHRTRPPKCYGGFGRIAHEIRKYRSNMETTGVPVLYLNAGDTYTGTPWYTVFKHKIVVDFLNKLKPDVMALGNHEFDDGVEGLMPLLNGANFPIVACNLALNKSTELFYANQLGASAVINVMGAKVGVIGYITPTAKNLLEEMPLDFLPEIPAIEEEALKLKADGVNIIIALGHSGLSMDIKIAQKCEDVDIVVGGHSHTFLYSGAPPDVEEPSEPYPYVVKKANGQLVPIVQAYAFTKYLGKLQVQFDEEGNLIGFEGSPILLDDSNAEEYDVLKLLDRYRPKMRALQNEIVGRTKVYLDGRSEVCRFEECNLGNLITDSMIHARTLENQNFPYWTDAAIAIINSGGIRDSVELTPDGTISALDLISILPFENQLLVMNISGMTLSKALENSAAAREKEANGAFLQVSGIHVVYDYYKPVGSRIFSVTVRCAECLIPRYFPLEMDRLYGVIVPSYLYKNGDSFAFEQMDPTPIKLNVNDIQALRLYLKKKGVVYPEVEGRITAATYEMSLRYASKASFLFAKVWHFILIISSLILIKIT